MTSVEIEVRNRSGLHARPAAVFARAAAGYASAVTLQNLTGGSATANAKSLLGVLVCGVKQGDRVRVEAHGPDEGAAIEALGELVASGLGEA